MATITIARTWPSNVQPELLNGNIQVELASGWWLSLWTGHTLSSLPLVWVKEAKQKGVLMGRWHFSQVKNRQNWSIGEVRTVISRGVGRGSYWLEDEQGNALHPDLVVITTVFVDVKKFTDCILKMHFSLCKWYSKRKKGKGKMV